MDFKNPFKKKPKKEALIASNKEKRDTWLKSKGYTVNTPEKRLVKHPKPLSNYRAQLLTFFKLKSQNKINIKSYKNRFGIPFYDLK